MEKVCEVLCFCMEKAIRRPEGAHSVNLLLITTQEVYLPCISTQLFNSIWLTKAGSEGSMEKGNYSAPAPIIILKPAVCSTVFRTVCRFGIANWTQALYTKYKHALNYRM